MHTFLLSLPDLDDEKQMLRHLPYIQLGLCYDVYSPYIYSQLLYMDTSGIRPYYCNQVGALPMALSREIFGKVQQLIILRYV